VRPRRPRRQRIGCEEFVAAMGFGE
jgi:hypothetical protein